MTTGKFLGIEIGGTKLQVVSSDGDDKLLSTHRFTVNREEGAAGIRSKIEQTIIENYVGKITAVGIGFGGPVNRLTGRIETSFHIDGWSGFPITDWLRSIMKAPVFIDNDANVAALGEATYGAGRGFNNVLYITIGSGVGGGLVINQQIYHGAVPGEVEIGHIQMDRSGNTLQSCCSGWAVDEKIRKVINDDPNCVLAELVANSASGEASILKAAMDLNDKTALQIFEAITDDLAFGLSHAIHLLHPDILILGGGLSLMGEILRERIELKLPRYLMQAFSPGPVVKLAQLKEYAVPVGGIILAGQQSLHL